MQISTLVIATRNPGKLREFRSLLAETGLKILGLTDLPIQSNCEETGLSFAENARLKAVSYSLHTELPVLADDSGLEVPALGGVPGIHSARYVGPGASDSERIGKLLSELQQTGADRQARFVCVLALAENGSVILEIEGECQGEIAHEPRGSNGFGYDPVFLLPKLGRTYGELSEEEKNRCSHRCRAVQLLLEKLSCS